MLHLIEVRAKLQVQPHFRLVVRTAEIEAMSLVRAALPAMISAKTLWEHRLAAQWCNWYQRAKLGSKHAAKTVPGGSGFITHSHARSHSALTAR